jgi:hypothetical protein
LTSETSLYAASAPTKKLRSIERFLRTKSKNALCVSTDRKEINALGQKLDQAVEELSVCALPFQNHLSLFTPFTRLHPPFAWSSG